MFSHNLIKGFAFNICSEYSLQFAIYLPDRFSAFEELAAPLGDAPEISHLRLLLLFAYFLGSSDGGIDLVEPSLTFDCKLR